MIGLALLFAFAPRTAALSSGPPAPHLAHTPARQARLSQRVGWRNLVDVWSGTAPGRWHARFDERTGLPRFVYVPGLPAAHGPDLVADLARLAGADPAELTLSHTTKRGDRRIRRYTRSWRGAPVFGDQVALVEIDGRIAGVWVQLTPVRLTDRPTADEVVFPVDRFGPNHGNVPVSNGVRAVLATESRDGFIRRFRDRSGAVVGEWDTRHFDTIQVAHEERTVGDPLVTSPARGVLVEDASGRVDTTDASGAHTLSGPVTAVLDGPDMRLRRDGADVEGVADGDTTLTADVELSYATADVLHHFHVVWDWLGDRWPAHPWLGDQVDAQVDLSTGTCNAYYTSGTINFYRASSGRCTNFGRIADVVYHEVGHGIHHYILAAGTFASDISEGSSDYVSATILEDPELAPGAYPDGSGIREIETDKVYPDDAIGESHNDGLIWASFLWNLRTQWMADMGDEAGIQATDLLFLGALEQGPTMTDVYEAVVLADDDDGDLTNGTPHDCELLDLMSQHGLGPGPIGVVHYDHTPLGHQGSDTAGYDVQFELGGLFPGCGDFDDDSVQLWYSTGFSDVPGVVSAPEPGGGEGPPEDGDWDTGDTGAPEPDPYADWASVTLTATADGWVGTIPRQPATTRVWYFMEAADTTGEQRVFTHDQSESGLYSFQVGDREELWCEDFESGAPDFTHSTNFMGEAAPPDAVDDWQIGEAFDDDAGPTAAFDGVGMAATNLVGDYSPNSLQVLQSGDVTLPDDPGPMFQLSYQRYLEVEDGYYDQAALFVGETAVWANPATPQADSHLLDAGWTTHDVSLDGLVDGPTQFSFALRSDQGLQFYGWGIDDLCVVQLDDLNGHYRTGDLLATDDDPEHVTISWTQPWMTPIAMTALVRKAGDYPSGPDDGLILDLDLSPVPGKAREVVDLDAMPGEVFYYALFAAGDDQEDWYVDVVEGENADLGGVLEPVIVDTGDSGGADTGEWPDRPTDTGDDDPAEAPPGEGGAAEPGCGCNAASLGGGAMVWLALLPAWMRRRRSL